MGGQEIPTGKKRGGNEVICQSGKQWRDRVREKDRLLCIDFVYLNNSAQPTLLEKIRSLNYKTILDILVHPPGHFRVREVHAFPDTFC